MKNIIEYYASDLDIRSLLTENKVSLTTKEKEELTDILEKYLVDEKQDYLKLDLKNFYLIIKGWDEAGNVLSAICWGDLWERSRQIDLYSFLLCL